MSAAHKLTPRTIPLRADSVRPGHIVMESDEHPAVVIRATQHHGVVTLWCRYIWQATHEPVWPFGPLAGSSPIDVSKER